MSKRDPFERLRQGDGGGEVWADIERQLSGSVPVSPVSRLFERLDLDGTPLEAALRSPPATYLLGGGAATSLLVAGLLNGPATPALAIAAPLLAGVAGAATVYSTLEPGYELTRASGHAPLLVVARQLVTWLTLGLPLLLALPWLPPHFLAAWLLPSLLMHSLALVVGLPLGSYAGMTAAGLAWAWLVADYSYRTGEIEQLVLAFPTSSVQLALIAACLGASWMLAGRSQRRPVWGRQA